MILLDSASQGAVSPVVMGPILSFLGLLAKGDGMRTRMP